MILLRALRNVIEPFLVLSPPSRVHPHTSCLDLLYSNFVKNSVKTNGLDRLVSEFAELLVDVGA